MSVPEPPRLSEFSLGLGSTGGDASSSDESGPEEFDMDEEARIDAGGRAMEAIKSDDASAFVEALRDLMPFLKD